MQIIDYWVGVPLCFLLTVWRSLVNLFSPATRVPPKNILFIELSEMGSAFLAYSALQQTLKKYPGCALYFLIFRKNAESCEILNVIPKENILTIDDRNFLRFSISTFFALLKIRSLKMDTVIDMELFSRATALITYLTGAANRVGFHRGTNEGLYRGTLLTHEVPYNPHTHISLSFLALVNALESDPRSIPLVKKDLRPELLPLPQLPIAARDAELVEKLLLAEKRDLRSDAQLIVVNPDPGDALPIRGWPLERFIEVSRELHASFPNAVSVVIGLKRSKPYADALIKALGSERCIDLTGKTPNLKAVLALMKRSKLLVSNDSGPGHLAALTGLPGVVLFGPETPALYGPLSDKILSMYAEYSCSPCLSALNHRYTKCNDNQCLKAITVQQVLAPARSILQTGALANNDSPHISRLRIVS